MRTATPLATRPMTSEVLARRGGGTEDRARGYPCRASILGRAAVERPRSTGRRRAGRPAGKVLAKALRGRRRRRRRSKHRQKGGRPLCNFGEGPRHPSCFRGRARIATAAHSRVSRCRAAWRRNWPWASSMRAAIAIQVVAVRTHGTWSRLLRASDSGEVGAIATEVLAKNTATADPMHIASPSFA